MYPFIAGAFEITTEEGRPVAQRLFRSMDEILEFIGGQPVGRYHVYGPSHRDLQPPRESELWAEVVHGRGGGIGYILIPAGD